MSKQTKHRYLNSFFITSVLYLIASFFLFYVFADTLVIEEKKPEEVKISIKHMMTQQEPTPVQAIAEPIHETTPPPKPEPVVEKKMDKPKKEKRHEDKHIERKHHEFKKPKKEPVQEVVRTEVMPITQVIQKTPAENTPTKQIDTAQIENIEADYLSKIRNSIEKNKTYPKTAKRLNQTGKVYVTFTVTKDGGIKNCRIHRSSSFESLDEASLEIFAKIASFDSIPKELNKNDWEITVPIVYQMN
ncbi:MAG: TonB family protein [Aliarcobacter sp.]|nr:TonB family protein [Aliarcobacter sp.]